LFFYHDIKIKQAESNKSKENATKRTILETPCMFLDSGRKPEYPERTQEYAGRTCKLHTERPQSGVEPGTFSL